MGKFVISTREKRRVSI